MVSTSAEVDRRFAAGSRKTFEKVLSKLLTRLRRYRVMFAFANFCILQ